MPHLPAWRLFQLQPWHLPSPSSSQSSCPSLVAIFTPLQVADETTGTRAMVVSITCTVIGVRPAPDSGPGAGCLARVQRTACNGRVQPAGFLFVVKLVLLVEIRYVSRVEPRMRPLGETAGRLPDSCPTGLLILFSCCVKCKLWTECRKIARTVGPS